MTRTAASLLCSRSSRPADRIARVAVPVAVEQVLNGLGREVCLGKKSNGAAGRDQFGIIPLGMGRDQNYR